MKSIYINFIIQLKIIIGKVQVQGESMTNKPKNHFKVDNDFEMFDKKENDKILIDKVDKVMKEKFTFLVQIYLNSASEHGYNSMLAFRVICLFLHCEFKNNDNDMIEYNLIDEVNRFINYQLDKGQLTNVQRCMDVLMLKQLNDRVADKHLKFWRIKVLNSLKKYYAVNHIKKQKKKASFTMRELCKQQLKKQAVKHETQIYTNILDILIQQQRIIMNSKKGNGKPFEAIENGNNIIRILEKSEQIIIPKFQQQLMLAYWDIAKLHFDLHYVTYAKKYCETTLNIAERINDKKMVASAKGMLDSLTNCK